MYRKPSNEEKRILEALKGYMYNVARIEEINEKIDKVTQKVTVSYDTVGFGGGVRKTSGVERNAIKKNELCQKKAVFERNKEKIDRVIMCSGLNDMEREIVEYICNNSPLQGYARQNRIKQSTVYYFRDMALHKMAAYAKAHNVVF